MPKFVGKCKSTIIVLISPYRLTKVGKAGRTIKTNRALLGQFTKVHIYRLGSLTTNKIKVIVGRVKYSRDNFTVDGVICQLHKMLQTISKMQLKELDMFL